MLLQPSPAKTLTCCSVVVAARYCSPLRVSRNALVEGGPATACPGWLAATAVEGANAAEDQVARKKTGRAKTRLHPRAAEKRLRLITGLLGKFVRGKRIMMFQDGLASLWLQGGTSR